MNVSIQFYIEDLANLRRTRLCPYSIEPSLSATAPAAFDMRRRSKLKAFVDVLHNLTTETCHICNEGWFDMNTNL